MKKENASESPNDPELSERGAGRDACAAGLRGAGSVTRGTVRSSAWLGVIVLDILDLFLWPISAFSDAIWRAGVSLLGSDRTRPRRKRHISRIALGKREKDKPGGEG